MQSPELLAPAGNFEKLKTALRFGADAVYLGGKSFSLRSFSDNFTDEELKAAAEYVHARGKKMYVTVNIFAKNSDFSQLEKTFRFLQEIGADAALVTDAGVFALARKVAPNLPLHISTQANTTNAYAARFWQEAGAERVVLADFPVVDYRQDNAASSMKSRKKVFCVADEMHELDRWFAGRPALRERFAYEKWMVHYNAYSANLPRLAFPLQREFLELFRREFSEARERGELPETFLRDARIRRRLPLLLRKPQRYLFIMRRRFVVHRLRDFFRRFAAVFPKGGRR